MRYEYDEASARWVCLDCPRAVQVHPTWQVIEAGDRNATHQGATEFRVELICKPA